MSRAYETIIAGLNSFDPDERRLSVEASVRFGDREEVLDKLIELLKDEDKGVRDAVANSLWHIANEFDDTKDKIIKSIANLLLCEDLKLRNLSAELLVKFGKSALKDVIKLANHDDKDIRKMAIDVIGLIGDDSVTDFLIEKLNDPDPNVVTSAIEALGNIGNDKAIGKLIDVFQILTFAQTQIVESLGKLCKNSGLKKILCEFFTETFATADDPILKCAIVEAIGKAGDSRNLEFLMSLTFDRNIAIQKMAIVSIVNICAREKCEFKSNKHFFKSFFEKAIEIFNETDDREFKLNFLNFASKWIEHDYVKKFILNLLNERNELTEKAIDILNSNAKDFLKFSLENETNAENFIDLVEILLYNCGKIFEDVGLRKLVVDKLTNVFYDVAHEKKITVLNLLASLDVKTFEKIMKQLQGLDDPVFRDYADMFGLNFAK